MSLRYFTAELLRTSGEVQPAKRLSIVTLALQYSDVAPKFYDFTC
jgi:hypothetical protein